MNIPKLHDVSLLKLQPCKFDSGKWQISTWIDLYVASQIGIPPEEYQKTLIDQFNGVIIDEACNHLGAVAFILFNNEIDASNAIDWAESIYVMDILSGGE